MLPFFLGLYIKLDIPKGTSRVHLDAVQAVWLHVPQGMTLSERLHASGTAVVLRDCRPPCRSLLCVRCRIQEGCSTFHKHTAIDQSLGYWASKGSMWCQNLEMLARTRWQSVICRPVYKTTSCRDVGMQAGTRDRHKTRYFLMSVSKFCIYYSARHSYLVLDTASSLP
jgi:hypothetical protein